MTLCSHFVLDSTRMLSYIIAHPGLTGGALARRRKCEAGSGPAAGLASLLAGGPWCLRAAKSKRLKAPRAKRHPGSSISPYLIEPGCRRATLDHPQGSQRKLRAPRCWLCDITQQSARARQTCVMASQPSRHSPRHCWPCASHPRLPEPQRRRGSRAKPGMPKCVSGRPLIPAVRSESRHPSHKRDHRHKPAMTRRECQGRLRIRSREAMASDYTYPAWPPLRWETLLIPSPIPG